MRPFLIFLCAGLFVFSCRNAEKNDSGAFLHVNGNAQGTTYHITYRDSLGRSFQAQVDSIFAAFNKEASTYDTTSVISLFNKSAESFVLPFTAEEAANWPIPAAGDKTGAHFISNYYASLDFFYLSEGAFDPTVLPLVNYWGFGTKGIQPVETVDSSRVDSLLLLVGMDKVLAFEGNQLKKTAPGVQLDFNAIAPGYCVDLLGKFLESYGISNYLVELGGEVRARGLNDRAEPWNIGINTPDPDAGLTEMKLVVQLKDRALATSGNYRKFYEVNGQKYVHTINPKTGYPEQSNLLSATILAPTATEADALATACMVMGLDKAYEFIVGQQNLDGCFIFANPDGTMDVRYTPALEAFIKK